MRSYIRLHISSDQFQSFVVGNDSVRALSSRPLLFYSRLSPLADVQRVQGARERGAASSHSVEFEDCCTHKTDAKIREGLRDGERQRANGTTKLPLMETCCACSGLQELDYHLFIPSNAFDSSWSFSSTCQISLDGRQKPGEVVENSKENLIGT